MLRLKTQKILQDYYQNHSNNILLIDGARKIGKSYIIRHEDQKHFKNYIEINFGEDKKGKRASDYVKELEYFTSPGVSLKVLAISNPKFPLKESESKKQIKLYMNDVGLLTNVLHKYNINAVLSDEKSINLGSVYESVVAQELHANVYSLKHYNNKGKGEVDFLVDDYDELTALPIEVKSGSDYMAHKALDNFVTDKDYNIKRAIVLSNNREGGRKKDKVIYFPVYYSMFLEPNSPKTKKRKNLLIFPLVKWSAWG